MVKNAVYNFSFLSYVVLHDLQRFAVMVGLGVDHSQKNGDCFSRSSCTLSPSIDLVGHSGCHAS